GTQTGNRRERRRAGRPIWPSITGRKRTKTGNCHNPALQNPARAIVSAFRHVQSVLHARSAVVAEPFAVFHLTMSNSPARSRGAFLRPGRASLLHQPRIEGWAERRETFGCCARHPLGVP